jgi:hypothetical protein
MGNEKNQLFMLNLSSPRPTKIFKLREAEGSLISMQLIFIVWLSAVFRQLDYYAVINM